MNTGTNRQILRLVLDTNIIISALNFGGTPAIVMDLAVSGEIQNITSQVILDEVKGGLIRKFLWEKTPAQDVCEMKFKKEPSAIGGKDMSALNKISAFRDQRYFPLAIYPGW